MTMKLEVSETDLELLVKAVDQYHANTIARLRDRTMSRRGRTANGSTIDRFRDRWRTSVSFRDGSGKDLAVSTRRVSFWATVDGSRRGHRLERGNAR
jgi:hypothetical protein